MASSKAMDLLHWAMRLVLYRHIAMVIKMASKKGGVFFIVVLLFVTMVATGAIWSE